MEETKEEWGYRAGPGDAMKQEIGQIVINHALCDEPLLELFTVLSGAPSSTAYILVQSLNLKAGGMTKAILDLAKSRTPAVNEDLNSRLTSAISDYRKLSLLRNEVAHWQWYPSVNNASTANASNVMRRNSDGSQVVKEFTLHSLKQLSVGLITTFSALKLFAGLIQHDVPSFALTNVFANLDQISEKVKEALLSLPEPAAEELP
ncbi:hypothetical protein D3C77_478960 [compost metagenome]